MYEKYYTVVTVLSRHTYSSTRLILNLDFELPNWPSHCSRDFGWLAKTACFLNLLQRSSSYCYLAHTPLCQTITRGYWRLAADFGCRSTQRKRYGPWDVIVLTIFLELYHWKISKCCFRKCWSNDESALVSQKLSLRCFFSLVFL